MSRADAVGRFGLRQRAADLEVDGRAAADIRDTRVKRRGNGFCASREPVAIRIRMRGKGPAPYSPTIARMSAGVQPSLRKREMALASSRLASRLPAASRISRWWW